jgi:hypothetical protein
MLISVISLIVGFVFLIKPSFFTLAQHSLSVNRNRYIYMRIIGLVFIALSVYVAIMRLGVN